MRTVDGELSDAQIALYRAFLAGTLGSYGNGGGNGAAHSGHGAGPAGPTGSPSRSSRSFADAAREAGSDPDQLDKDLERLLEMGLVRPAGADEYTAVSPLLAEATVLGVQELELSARRAELEMRRGAIRQAIPEWAETLRRAPAPGLVDIVTDPVASGNVVSHYAGRCQREVLSLAPGRGPGRIDPRTRTANVYALSRGVKIKSVYQHVALRDRVTQSYLRELSALGATIRVATSVPGRALVIDREVALLRLPGTEGGAGVAVVHEPNIVSWVIATFDQLWADATPVEEASADTGPGEDIDIDQTRGAILRLMAEGEKDEAISRRLNISVRTCRRHIADYMAAVGATSRFQAGVIASRAGHLH